jgi:hypothetical protein
LLERNNGIYKVVKKEWVFWGELYV